MVEVGKNMKWNANDNDRTILMVMMKKKGGRNDDDEVM